MRRSNFGDLIILRNLRAALCHRLASKRPILSIRSTVLASSVQRIPQKPQRSIIWNSHIDCKLYSWMVLGWNQAACNPCKIDQFNNGMNEYFRVVNWWLSGNHLSGNRRLSGMVIYFIKSPKNHVLTHVTAAGARWCPLIELSCDALSGLLAPPDCPHTHRDSRQTNSDQLDPRIAASCWVLGMWVRVWGPVNRMRWCIISERTGQV